MAGPWERYGAQAPQPAMTPRPQFPATIQGPAKQVDPMEAQRLDLSVDANNRADQQFANQRSNQAFDNVAKLRTEFEGRPEVKAFGTILPQAADAMRIAGNPNATGADDLSLIYAFGKVMDPNSVVREAELAMAGSTGSFAQNIEGAIAKIQSGERLPPEVRRNLVKAIQRRGVQLAQGYNRVRDDYRAMATRYGFNPEDIIGSHPGGQFQQVEANFLGAPIYNRDGSLGAVPAGMARPGEQRGPTFELGGGNGGQGGPEGPQIPPAGPDGYVVAPFNPNLGDNADMVRAQAQQMIANGASYNDVATFLYNSGLSFQEKPLRDATAQGKGTVAIGDNVPLSVARGLLRPLNRAAEGLETGANYLFGTNSNSATEANQTQDQFFNSMNATNPTAQQIGNIAGAGVLSAPFGPMAGGAIGNVLAGDADTGTEVARDALIGAAAGKVADWTIRGAAGALAPNIAPEARQLAAEGVEMTPGQLAGRRSTTRRLEERATSLPGGGGAAIEAARDRSVITFNRAAANRALKSVGKAVPKSIEPGNETVRFVQETLSQEYEDILSKATVSLDMGWARRVAAIRSKANLPAEQAAQFDEIVQREITATFGRNPTGSATSNGLAYKQFDEQLGDVAAQYMRSDDPYVRKMGEALADVRDQTARQLRAQNPKLAKRLKAADEGWAQYKRIEAAAAMSNDGIYTPAQLRTAVRQKDRSKDKRAVAQGTAVMQDLSRAGSEVLPSTVGNSGTADRMLVLDPRAYALGSIADRIYQPPVQNALASFLTAPRSPAAQSVANTLRQLPAGSIGGVGANALLFGPPK